MSPLYENERVQNRRVEQTVDIGILSDNELTVNMGPAPIGSRISNRVAYLVGEGGAVTRCSFEKFVRQNERTGTLSTTSMYWRGPPWIR